MKIEDLMHPGKQSGTEKHAEEALNGRESERLNGEGLPMRTQSLVLFVSVLSLASCRDSTHPLEPAARVGPSASLQVDLNPGTPVNLTQNPAFQNLAGVSGSIVVWRDKRDDPNGDLWGCSISTGLEACATAAVRLATDLRLDDLHAPSIAGPLVIWTNSANQLLVCDLSAGLTPGPDQDECIGAAQLVPSPRAQLFPRLTEDLATWIETSAATGPHIFACNMAIGCAATAQQISSDAHKPPLSEGAGPALSSSLVVWLDESFDIVACSIASGLDSCLADPANNIMVIGDSPWPDGGGYFWPRASGSFVVWTRLGAGSEHDLLGCDVSSGLANCAPVNLTSSLGQAEKRSAIDNGVLVWAAGLSGPTLKPGVVACDISACESSAVQLSIDPENTGRFPAVSGSIAAWQQLISDESGVLQLDIVGVKLGVGDEEPPPPDEPPGQEESRPCSTLVDKLVKSKECRLLALLRTPRYFDILISRASDQELVDLIKSSPESIEFLLEQVDYGWHLVDFLSGPPPVGTNNLRFKKSLTQELNHSEEIISFLTPIVDVLGVLGEGGDLKAIGALQVSGASLNILGIIADFAKAWRGAHDLVSAEVGFGSICPVRQMLNLYFDERIKNVSDTGSPLDIEIIEGARLGAWEKVEDLTLFNDCLAGLSQALNIPHDQLDEWFETAFLAYRWVGYDAESGQIRSAMGLGLADIAAAGF